MNVRHALSHAVMQLLQPLVRVLLRHGMAYDEFAELARRAYVNVAERDFALRGRKQTTSRISVITGLNRKEVARLQALLAHEDGDAAGLSQAMNRAAKVVAGWRHQHGAEAGETALLTPDEFAALVRRHSGDMPARAVLDELRHAGAVTVGEDGRYRLAPEGYGPKASDAERLTLLGEHAADLLGSIEHNLDHPKEEAWLQRRVFADHIPADHAEAVRAALKQHGLQTLAQARSTLTAHDGGDAPPAEGARRVVLGVYYYEQPARPAPPPSAAPQGDTE